MCKITFFSRLILIGALTWSTAVSSKLVGAKKSEFHLMLENNWPDPDPSITHFPHQTSCHYFYLVLSEEDVSIKKCPDGKLFDYFLHRCVEKESARCWSRRFSGIIHDHHHKASKKFKCPYGYGKFPDVTDCTRYYQCLSGKPRIKKCAPFEYFDKIKRKCVAEIHAVCADETDVVEHGYKCPRSEGSFTFSKDCSKFYQCIEKRPDLKTCPKYRLFDERKRKCISSEIVRCGPRYNPYEATTVSSMPMHDRTDKVTSDHKLTSEAASQRTSNTGSPTSHTDTEFSVPASTTQDDAAVTSSVRNVPTEQHDSSENDVSKESQESSEDRHKNDSKGSKASSEEIEKQSSKESVEDSREDNSKKSKKDSLENDLKESSENPDVDYSNFTNEFISTVEIESSHMNSTIQEAVTNANSLPSTESYPIAKVDEQCHPKDPTCFRERDKVLRCPDAYGFFPHPDDEKRFLHCSKFEIYVRSCPKQLIFQVSTRACVWPLDQAQKLDEAQNNPQYFSDYRIRQ